MPLRTSLRRVSRSARHQILGWHQILGILAYLTFPDSTLPCALPAEGNCRIVIPTKQPLFVSEYYLIAHRTYSMCYNSKANRRARPRRGVSMELWELTCPSLAGKAGCVLRSAPYLVPLRFAAGQPYLVTYVVFRPCFETWAEYRTIVWPPPSVQQNSPWPVAPACFVPVP